ncbi:MAG: hypothetical protein JWM68_5413 [Verrucomicrobiales bacterium]|nr:hypothetical protein [Verrucomicrobiales bacterium]
MISSITTFFTKKSVTKTTPTQTVSTSTGMQRRNHPEKAIFSKAFRWRLPEGASEPRTVEIVGSFNRWQKVEMKRDNVLNAWATIVHQIPGNRTHHYMLLLDGQPALDGNCDGLATPQGFEEQEFQLTTEKGPRVLMLFSQTK